MRIYFVLLSVVLVGCIHTPTQKDCPSIIETEPIIFKEQCALATYCNITSNINYQILMNMTSEHKKQILQKYNSTFWEYFMNSISEDTEFRPYYSLTDFADYISHETNLDPPSYTWWKNILDEKSKKPDSEPTIIYQLKMGDSILSKTGYDLSYVLVIMSKEYERIGISISRIDIPEYMIHGKPIYFIFTGESPWYGKKSPKDSSNIVFLNELFLNVFFKNLGIYNKFDSNYFKFP